MVRSKEICILCSRTVCKSDFVMVEEIHKEILEVLRINVTIKSGSKSIICNSCSEKTHESFAFKSVCLYTEDTITPSIDSLCRNGEKLDLSQFLKEPNNSQDNMAHENKIICRFCIKVVGNMTSTPLKNLNSKDLKMLQKYIPEMQLEVTVDPIICEICLICLKDYFNFVNGCSSAREVSTEKVDSEEMKVAVKSSKVSKSSNGCKSSSSGKDKVNTEYTKRKENGGEGRLRRKNFNSAAEYKKKKQTWFKCENCDFKTLYRSSLHKHGLMHKDIADIKMYSCEFCSFQTKYKQSWMNHKAIHEGNLGALKKFKCSICDYIAINSSLVKSHMLSHKSSSEVLLYRCTECPFKSKYRTSFEYHNVIHADTPPLKCELCTFKSKHKRILDAHKLTHNKNKKYKCDECGYQTAQKAYLVRHLKHHTEKKANNIYSCDQCPYKTKVKRLLTVHKLRHKLQPEFKCELCPFITHYKESLIRHVKIVHQTMSEVTLYKCESCPYQTKYKYQITKHRIVHDDSPTRYKCELCDFTAKYKSAVLQHQKQKHLESEAMECAECGFQTKDKFVLKNHVVIHLNVFYNCSICDYQTKHKRFLNPHYKRTHNLKDYKLLVE